MIKLPADLVARLRPAYEQRPVCVTGGAGFIGSHLVDALHALGSSITIIDDLSSSSAENIAPLIELDPDRVRLVHASILEDASLRVALRGARTVFHLAAIGSIQRSIEDPERTFAVNATGTLRVLREAQRAGVKRVLVAGSSSAYGKSPGLPKVETMRPEPLSPYAASKLAAEQLACVWASTFDLDTATLRYFNVFGPRQPADSDYSAVIPRFIARLSVRERPIIFGDGSQSRDFTYVANVVAATLLAGARPEPLRGDVFNVGAGTRTSVLELARTLAELIVQGDDAPEPEHRPARAGDVPHSVADISKAAQELAYKPIVGLRQGLTETVAWFRSLQSGPKDNSGKKA